MLGQQLFHVSSVRLHRSYKSHWQRLFFSQQADSSLPAPGEGMAGSDLPEAVGLAFFHFYLTQK
jgi:hypothetical protein